MTALAYHIESKEVENHIFRHNWIFRHKCIYKQPPLTKQWDYNIFVQIYSYFRYTGRLFLWCVLFVARCNNIRASWETNKQKRFSYRKKYIEEFVWRTSLFWLHALLSIMSFVAFFSNSLLLSRGYTCWMAPIKIHHIPAGGILCDDIMSERSKIWKSLAI